MKKIYYSWLLGLPKQNNIAHPWFYDFKKGSPFPDDFFCPVEKSLRLSDAQYEHYRCPAFLEWNRNMWIVKQPLDLNFYFSSDDKRIYHSMEEDTLKDYFFLHQSKDNLLQEAQFEYQILFWTKEKDVWIEVYPHPELSSIGLDLIPGTFCISNWTRPVSVAFKILRNNQKIFLKKDMPLYYIKLFCRKDQSKNFTLEAKEADDQLIKNLDKDINLKFYAKNESWNLMKERNEKQCPFLKIFNK